MPDCDLKISGAKVLDGSGTPGVFVDVIVNGDTIEEVGDCSDRVARENLNARGMTLAPGFIDVHTHDDFALAESHGMECKLSQGVTTVIAGNCGVSAAPLSRPEALPPPFPLLGRVEDFRFPEVDDYRQHLTQKLPATNVALLTGHSSLRLDVMPDRLTEAASEKRYQCHARKTRPGFAAGMYRAQHRAGLSPCGCCHHGRGDKSRRGTERACRSGVYVAYAR